MEKDKPTIDVVHNVQMVNSGPSNLLENLTFTFAYPQSQQVTPTKIVSLKGLNTAKFWYFEHWYLTYQRYGNESWCQAELWFLDHLYLKYHGYIKSFISKGRYLFCHCLLQVLNVSSAIDGTYINCAGLALTPEGLTNSTFRAFNLAIDSSKTSRSANKFVSIMGC